MSERDLEQALANYNRTLMALAHAFAAAADACDLQQLDPVETCGRLTRELLGRRMVIDRPVVDMVTKAITGYLAQAYGKTPREIHDEMWKAAPSDEWWEGMLARKRAERGLEPT